MAIDFFNKKEVMNDIEKNNNDIIEDYGNFINNKETTILSFDSNFKEDFGYTSDSIQSVEPINSNNDVVSPPNPIIESNEYSDINIKEYNGFDDLKIQTNFEPINNEQVELNSNYNNVQNINNYNYNPIIDSMENAENNIKNSEDINVAFSNLYKNNTRNENKIQEQLLEENNMPFKNNDQIIIAPDYSEVDPGYKKCPICGQKIREDYKQCFICGTDV